MLLGAGIMDSSLIEVSFSPGHGPRRPMAPLNESPHETPAGPLTESDSTLNKSPQTGRPRLPRRRHDSEVNTGHEIMNLERQMFNLVDFEKEIELERRYEPEMEPTHPGFHDAVYQNRRRQIANMCAQYKIGEPIPFIDYTDDEKRTWKIVLETVQSLYPSHMCDQFNQSFSAMMDTGIYSTDQIPQLETVSKYLQGQTGFRLRPVGGLTSPRSFLTSLAFRVFQCTQYVRHHSKPLHSVEPDVIHELLGHVTMFSDAAFADFSQTIGLAALVADDEGIEKLAKLYWFTVEFGLCHQGSDVRVYGAALASSYGEMQRSLQATDLHTEFDIDVVIATDRSETNYQPKYFVAESFENMEKSVREFAATLHGGRLSFQHAMDTVEIIMERPSEKITVDKMGKI